MNAKAGKQKSSKRRAAATTDVREMKWPILLDRSAMTEPQGSIILHADKEKRRYFTTPRKLRGKSIWLRSCFLNWLLLPEEKKFYWADGFWRDLCRSNVKFPLIMAELMVLLWQATRQATHGASEELRSLADYIDALNETKGDRGRRLLITETLYLYADRVLAGEHRKLNWKELRDEFWPDYQDTDANWQKFLRERDIPFEKVGQFRGGRKCVRKSGNNTH